MHPAARSTDDTGDGASRDESDGSSSSSSGSSGRESDGDSLDESDDNSDEGSGSESDGGRGESKHPSRDDTGSGDGSACAQPVRGVGGAFVAADAPALPPPYIVVSGAVAAKVAARLQKAMTAAMRKQPVQKSAEGVSDQHVWRYTRDWTKHSSVHKTIRQIYRRIMPLARDFCVRRNIATAHTFDALWDKKVRSSFLSSSICWASPNERLDVGCCCSPTRRWSCPS